MRRRDSGEQPNHQEADPSRKTGESNWVSLVFGLVWFALIASTIYLFAKSDIEEFYLIVAIVAFLLTYPVIISFELLNRQTLSEKGFMGVLKMSYAKIPGLGKFLGS